MSANEIVEKAKSILAKDAVLAGNIQSAWNRILDKIEARALSQRPLPTRDELRSETEHARLVLLTSVVDGHTVPGAETMALAAVSLA